MGCRVSTCRGFRAFGVSNVELQDAISSNCRRPVLKGFRALTSPRAGGPCTQVVCDLAFGLKVPIRYFGAKVYSICIDP